MTNTGKLTMFKSFLNHARCEFNLPSGVDSIMDIKLAHYSFDVFAHVMRTGFVSKNVLIVMPISCFRALHATFKLQGGVMDLDESYPDDHYVVLDGNHRLFWLKEMYVFLCFIITFLEISKTHVRVLVLSR